MLTCLEFFAGSGLVRLGLSEDFSTIWANDNCRKKRSVYVANHSAKQFCFEDIGAVHGDSVPAADLAWASFPCQDLSLAGNLGGMSSGTRSGLFWEWTRVLAELKRCGRQPGIVVAENVVGFVVSDGGKHFREAYSTLRELGYRVGALVIDALDFLPQSRPRAFIVAVLEDVPLDEFSQSLPSSHFHSPTLIRAGNLVEDDSWVWWSLPKPVKKIASFSELCEWDAPCDPASKTQELCAMLSPLNKKRLDSAVTLKASFAGTAYRRTRPGPEETKVQRLEVRFDGVAGCLRTPAGGSSRQSVFLVENGVVRSRLLTVRECARLMGAPDTFKLEASYNDCYRAMGDAVAVPVTRWLSRHLLRPLAERCQKVAHRNSIFGPRNEKTEAVHASGLCGTGRQENGLLG